tara:strand:- start:911 stop:1549 length:639 start_codon:yes stop_codon:yes gene_type:complete
MSTLRTLSKFQSKLQGGGARPNLFEVSIPDLPDAAKNSSPKATWGSDEQENFSIMCKAAQLPASTIASIDVPFRGRTLKVAGDRTIENWNITIINDEDFAIRNAMEAWMNAIAKLSNNTGAVNPSSYMTDAYVYQLGRGYSSGRFSKANSDTDDGESITPLKSFKFLDIFPVSVSAIDLSYDSGDTIEEFTVEFAVQSFESLSDDATGVALN